MKRLVAAATVLLLIMGFASANDLATYKDTYTKEMDAIILAHVMQMTNLGQQYTKALDELLTKVKSAGDLDKTTAVMDEIKRFASEKKMPEKPAALLDIQNLQAYFTKQASAHDSARAEVIVTLTAKYDQALDRLQKSLVVSDKLDDAKAVQAERKRVAEADYGKSAKALIEQAKVAANERSAPNPKTSGEPAPLIKLTGSEKEWIFLADVDPVEAKVGYGKLERYGKDGEGLGIGDKKFETGLMAHATSSVVYDLNGKYTELSACYGMKNGAGGSAVFHIIVDEKEVFKSDGMWSYGKTKSLGHKPVTIKLTGALRLELKTVGVSGGAGAWSAWGDPKIR